MLELGETGVSGDLVEGQYAETLVELRRRHVSN